jgi:hypothetical protein
VVTEAETRVLEAVLAYAEEWIGKVAGPLPNHGTVESPAAHIGVVAYDGPRWPGPGAPVIIALTTQREFVEYVTPDGARFPTQAPRDPGAVLRVIGPPDKLLEQLALSLKALPEVSDALEWAARALRRVRK